MWTFQQLYNINNANHVYYTIEGGVLFTCSSAVIDLTDEEGEDDLRP